ncbi:uncharacterized protein LOC122247272 [Penaeus japonicus]|uniref:uncharacterized protein LOC122247272 n=1 Tax=Penaeus japonicus TaxID=27405 RepID=UPI001C70CEE3|nr:uncharacterized protein LOC122247272 [Penaeus japonicus]
MPALLPLLLALLCHDAFGRAPEGVLGRENVEEETNGTGEGAAPSSEVKQGDLTPWEPRIPPARSRIPNRRLRPRGSAGGRRRHQHPRVSPSSSPRSLPRIFGGATVQPTPTHHPP